MPTPPVVPALDEDVKLHDSWGQVVVVGERSVEKDREARRLLNVAQIAVVLSEEAHAFIVRVTFENS